MKKQFPVKLLVSILFLAMFNITSAQQWKDNLPAKKAGTYTLFEYQKAFNDYWTPLNVQGGYYINEKGEKQKAPGWKQFKRWEYYWKTRVDNVTGEFPNTTAWEVWQDYKKTLPDSDNTKSQAGNWITMGPANLDREDLDGALQENGTGRLNCMTFDPNDDNHFWVGAASGGVWESFDAGTTWACISDQNPILGISVIALPSDYNKTTNKTMYLATGDRDAVDDPSIGVLKTTDGGATWNTTGLTFGASDNTRIGGLVCSESVPNDIVAATFKGIYKSTDAGATWTMLQTGPFIDMDLIPGTNTLIATTISSVLAYTSTDFGDTWTETYTGTAGAGGEYRLDVATTGADASIVYLISSYYNTDALYAIYKSTNGGSYFSKVYDALTKPNLFGWTTSDDENDGGQGWYDIALAISNTDANDVYVGGVNGWVSTDGALNFTNCNIWAGAYSSADVVHADHHNAYFRPSDNRLFDVNDGGVYYCDNVTAGLSSDWDEITDGIITGQIYDIGISRQNPGMIVAGFQDNGTKLLTTNNPYDWTQVKGGDGMCCDIDPTLNSTQWGTYVALQVDQTSNTWGSASSIRNGGGAAWAGPLEADPQGSTVYVGGDAVEMAAAKSLGKAPGSFSDISQVLDATSYLSVLDIFNDGTNKMIWTASPNGCWKSPLGGSGTYTAVLGLPTNTVTDIAIDEDDYNHVYVCFGGYDATNVYETTDGGTNWTDISASLPGVPTGSIVINEANTSDNEVYVGTDAGIYVKLGDSPWQLFNTGMPFVSITDLEVYADVTPVLYAATYGRGIWKGDCYVPPVLDLAIADIVGPVAVYCEAGTFIPAVTVSNIGSTTITTATIEYSIDGGATVSQGWSGDLAQGASVDVIFPAAALSFGSYSIEFTIVDRNGNGSDESSVNDVKSTTYALSDNSLPYTQNFDNFVSQSGNIGTSIDLDECWSNDPSDSSPNLDWSCTSGATPSGSTGPSGDNTSGTGKYLFTETSSDDAELKMANLLSPTFDLTNYTSPSISFWYHMLGNEIGTIQVDLYYNASWNNAVSVSWDGSTATSLSGAQGDAWYQAIVVDASAAAGFADFQVRISITTGTKELANGTNFYQSDFAIDDFTIDATIACTQPTTQTSNFGATPDYTTMDLTWDRGTGNNILVVAHEGSAVDINPSFGVNYADNATFSSGDEIGTGNFVVYDGTASAVTVTGLAEGTTYHFAFYEYNTADNCYLTPGFVGNSTTLVHAPSITGVTPDNFFTDKGKQLIIAGTYLEAVTSVTIGGVSGTIDAQDATSITVTFPASNYADNTLTATNTSGSDNITCTVNTRNIIPVGSGTEFHATIQSALDGLFAWYGTTSFDAGQLPGAKIIDVYNGTYAEVVTPNATMTTTATEDLTIRNALGQAPVINATGLSNAIYIGALDNVTVSGFTAYGSTNDVIYSEGDNNTISLNKSYSSTAGSGIKLSASNNSTVANNLLYTNYNYGIHIVSSDNVETDNNTAYENGHSVAGGTQQLFFEGWETGTTGWTMGDWLQDIEAPRTGTYNARLKWANSSMSYLGIDIIDMTNIQLTFWYRNLQHEGDEPLEAFYQVDNGGWNSFMSITTATANYLSSNTAIPVGSVLDIMFTASNNQNNERWYIDDIEVTADLIGENIGTGLYIESGANTSVENNIFVAKTGTDYVAMETGSGITLTSDYNTYFKNGNTNIVKYNGTLEPDLIDWTTSGANDLEGDPLFTDGIGHINSLIGYYQGTEWPPSIAAGTWATDTDSPALDAGNPADPYTVEPQAGGRINQGAYGNTAQASKSISLNFIWEGDDVTTPDDWQTITNWDIELIPSGGDNVTIPDVTNDPIIDDGELTAVCSNLQIDAGANLTIAPNGQMTVYGTLTNTDGITGLILQSDATGDASLIQSNSGINASVQRYLGTGTIPEWHFIASPITDAAVGLFPTNFYSYDESTDDWWTESTLYGTSGWTVPSSGTMTPALGYINYNTSTTTANFQGPLNYAVTYPIVVPYTEHTDDAANGEPYTNFDGWALIGNPFTSALDWEAINKTDNITTTVYYYDDGASNYAYYQDGGLSVNFGSRYIPPMQGFFVKSNNTAGGSVDIPSTARVHDTQTFWKSEQIIENLIKLRIDYNGYSDETVVRFHENATTGFDDQLDAYKRYSWSDEVAQINTYIPEINTDFAINTVYGGNDVIIPLVYKVNADDSYTLYSNEFNFDSYSVYLRDIEKSIDTELTLDKSYTFNSEAGTFKNRFELVFEKSSSTVGNFTTADVVIFPNPNTGSFYLKVGNPAKNYSVEVHNITGQVVYKNEFINSGTKEIKLDDKSPGVYFIKVIFDNNYTVNKKIIIQ